MRVVITGAAGFLGSHLADRFLADGHSVVGVDNFLTGRPENIAHLRDNRRFTLLEQDVSLGLRIADPCDGVLHFASPASPVDYQALPIETLRVGSAGTFNALELARTNAARFLIASTSEIYGDPIAHPQVETDWGNVNPIGPRSMYDEAKRFSEATTMAYHRTHRLDTRIARIFNTYGPRMRPRDGRVVSNFIVQALAGEPITMYGEGLQTRSFCFVSDQVEGLYRVFMRGDHLPINVGNAEEFTMRELAGIILELTGSTSPIVFEPLPADDPRQRQPDITRAGELLQWEPAVPLREGIATTIAHFQCLLRPPHGAGQRLHP